MKSDSQLMYALWEIAASSVQGVSRRAPPDAPFSRFSGLSGKSIVELKEACNEKPECVGFNSAGWLKSARATARGKVSKWSGMVSQCGCTGSMFSTVWVQRLAMGKGKTSRERASDGEGSGQKGADVEPGVELLPPMHDNRWSPRQA